MLKVTSPDGTTVHFRGDPSEVFLDCTVQVDRCGVENYFSMKKKGLEPIPATRPRRCKAVPPKGYFCETIPESDSDDDFPEFFAKAPAKAPVRANGRRFNQRACSLTPSISPGKSLRTPSPEIMLETSGNDSNNKRSLRSRGKNKRTEPVEGVEQISNLQLNDKPEEKILESPEKFQTVDSEPQVDQSPTESSLEESPRKSEEEFQKSEEQIDKSPKENPKKSEAKTAKILKAKVKNSKAAERKKNPFVKDPSPRSQAGQASPPDLKKKTSRVLLISNGVKSRKPPHAKKHPPLPHKASKWNSKIRKPETHPLFSAPFQLLRPFKIPRVKAKPTENHGSNSTSPAKVRSAEVTLKAQLRKLFQPNIEPIQELTVLSVLKEKNSLSFESSTSVLETVEESSREDEDSDEISIVAEFGTETNRTDVNAGVGIADDECSNPTISFSDPMDWDEVLQLHPEDRDLYRLFS